MATTTTPSSGGPACAYCPNEDGIWMKVRGNSMCGSCGAMWKPRPARATPTAAKLGLKLIRSSGKGKAPRARRGLMDITNGTSTPRGSAKKSAKKNIFGTTPKNQIKSADTTEVVAATPVAAKAESARKVCRVGDSIVLLLIRGQPSSEGQMTVQMHYPVSGKTSNFFFTASTLSNVSSFPSAVRKTVLAHISSRLPTSAATPETEGEAEVAGEVVESNPKAPAPSTAAVSTPQVMDEYSADAPKYSEAEVEVIKKQVTQRVAAEMEQRHQKDTAFLLSEFERVQDDVDDLMKKNHASERRIQEYDDIIAEFEATCTKVAADKDAAIASIEQQLKEQSITLTATQATLVASVEKADKFQAELKRLQSEMNEQEVAAFKSMEQSASTISDLREEVERFQGMERGWEQEKVTFEKQLGREKAKVKLVTEQAQTQLSAAKATYEKLQARDKQHQAEAAAITKAYKELQEKTADFQAKGRASVEENEKLAAKVVSLHREVESQGTQIAELEGLVADKTREAQEASDQSDASSATATRLAAELSGLKESFTTKLAASTQALEGKLNDYKLQIFDLKESLEKAEAASGSSDESDELRAQLVAMTQERDAAVQKSAELESISAELLAMVEGQ